MSQTKVKDMTQGSVIKIIVLFALPIYFGSVFQQFYNIVDTMIAGRYLGDDSLAAIGATSAIYSTVLSLANGMNNGYAIIVARAFGEKNYCKVRNSVGLMLILNITSAMILTVIAIVSLPGLLRVIQTPIEIMASAYTYIAIILAGLCITIFYNMEAAVLRALGNSKTPLIFLIAACFLNIFLDISFVVVFHMGVGGLAFATVISQFLSVIACFIHIKRNYPILKLERSNFKFTKFEMCEMFTTGLSMGLMYSIFNVGTLILQGSINALGTSYITAHLAARKIDEICMMPITTLSTSNATFVGQNFGAKKIKRVKEGIGKTCLLGFLASFISMIIIFAFSKIFVTFITGTSDKFIIDTASKYLCINLPFFYTLAVLQTIRTSLQGMGSKIAPLVSSVMELFIKVIASFFVVPVLGYFGVCIVEPITWILCMIWLIFSYYSFIRKCNKKYS